MRDISSVADDLGLPATSVVPYGRSVAKIELESLPPARGKLVLVSAITPTPHGEGKTTTSIGLGMGLAKSGERAVVCLRQPSMGPFFGRKGGGTGGGRARIEPHDRIDLHFTGDGHAVTSAHDLLAALVDHALHTGVVGGVERRLDPRRIRWSRVLDVDDRALRHVVLGLGGTLDGVPRESRFEITAASELMAVLCLASDRSDLRARIDRIVVAQDREGADVTVRELGATDALMALLWEAVSPNLVQTSEGSPALVHGGPFANVAHGCSSVIATRLGLAYADYVVTEAGFDFSLGGEKFLHLKCRTAGLFPDLVVLVVTLRALRHHGRGASEPLVAGLDNLRRHAENARAFGLDPLVCLNVFEGDEDADLARVERFSAELGLESARCHGFSTGGEGSLDLASAVRARLARVPSPTPRFLYPVETSYRDKISVLARTLYGARDVDYADTARRELAELETRHGGLGVCIAKTPDSFSDDPAAGGLARDFVPTVTEVNLSAGAGFVVAKMGAISTMPGFPREPAALRMRTLEDGRIEVSDP